MVEWHAPDIDEELLDILEGLDAYSRVLFTGTAGTGKTRMLGLEATRLRATCDVLHAGAFREFDRVIAPSEDTFNPEKIAEEGRGWEEWDPEQQVHS